MEHGQAKQVPSLLLEERGDLTAPRGSRAWALGVRWELQRLLRRPGVPVRHLKAWLLSLERYKGYRQLTDPTGQPFASLTAFCTAPPPHGLGCEAALIERLMSAGPTVTLGELCGLSTPAPSAQPRAAAVASPTAPPPSGAPRPSAPPDTGPLRPEAKRLAARPTPLARLRYWWQRASEGRARRVPAVAVAATPGLAARGRKPKGLGRRPAGLTPAGAVWYGVPPLTSGPTAPQPLTSIAD
ncbi:MAG: hypothetical protein KatS3mg131_0610 [Candidatus Tectimicrobiota bacterium]|nr:MAG: hypothetical protein KatS3mg131_0610 [Candidatus Tectomicrobia bacterium]